MGIKNWLVSFNLIMLLKNEFVFFIIFMISQFALKRVRVNIRKHLKIIPQHQMKMNTRQIRDQTFPKKQKTLNQNQNILKSIIDLKTGVCLLFKFNRSQNPTVLVSRISCIIVYPLLYFFIQKFYIKVCFYTI